MRARGAALFLSHAWFLQGTLLSNVPYWSVPFEFWYYAIFGAWVFGRGKWRWLLAGGAALVAGPVILLYLPIWLMGVLAYHLGQRRPLPQPVRRPWIGR